MRGQAMHGPCSWKGTVLRLVLSWWRVPSPQQLPSEDAVLAGLHIRQLSVLCQAPRWMGSGTRCTRSPKYQTPFPSVPKLQEFTSQERALGLEKNDSSLRLSGELALLVPPVNQRRERWGPLTWRLLMQGERFGSPGLVDWCSGVWILQWIWLIIHNLAVIIDERKLMKRPCSGTERN